MAFPTIVGTPAESSTNTAGTSHIVNLPSGASGNLFLLVMGKGTTSATINALTGWTELVDENQASGAFCAWHLCDGTEGTTTTFTSSASTKSATIVYEINGQSAVAPEISAVASASTNAPNPNTCTPTGGAKDYLWITWFVMGQAAEEADDDTWVNNAATNYGSLRQKTSGTVGTNIGAAVAACHRTNNASSEDAAWPASSTDQTITWRSFTVAIHPIQEVNPASPGSFSETGVAATILADRLLAGGGAPGSYSVTGVDATLLVAAAAIEITASPGSYAETGVAANLEAARLLAGGAVAGSYLETGVAGSLEVGRLLDGGALPAVYVESGAAATLAASRLLEATVGVFQATGVAATLEVGRAMEAEPGSYVVTGVAATLETAGGGGGTVLIPQSMALGSRMGVRLG